MLVKNEDKEESIGSKRKKSKKIFAKKPNM